MSSISNLFGDVDSSKIESSVDKLFSSSTGPIDETLPKLKPRTVLPSNIKRKTVESNTKSTETPKAAQPVGTVEKVEEPCKKKQKKAKSNGEDENEGLEAKYYSKLLEEDKKEESEEQDSGNEEKIDEKVSAEKIKSAKKLDLKDDELEKADKTIFIGNIPNTVITSKIIYKEFKKLFSTDPKIDDQETEEGKPVNKFEIESIRFRSISFDEVLPRKVAYVQQKLHKSRDSVNAYIIYKNKKIIKSVTKSLNGHIFHGHHLRVDSVSHPTAHDNKRSVFVGNLDFEEMEETLWRHFASAGDIEYVRIVRDSKTNVGKGFAYVQFKDFQSVNKALLLDGKPMVNKNKPDKKARKLRITRCKNMHKVAASANNGKITKKLTDSQKTKFGRAKRVLGKADRATVGKELTIEGARATKGQGVSLRRKKERSASGRVTKRSQAFKKAQADENSKSTQNKN